MQVRVEMLRVFLRPDGAHHTADAADSAPDDDDGAAPSANAAADSSTTGATDR